MASDAQETLYRIFAGLAGGAGSGASWSSGGMGGGAIGSAIAAETGEDKSSSGGAARVALNVVKSGMGIVPLVASLFGLFGGGEEKPAPMVKYILPERREFQAAATGAGFAEVDYDQTGMPRMVERRATSRMSGQSALEERQAPSAAPSITVNVQAMDARSFMDRSSDIAAAVREAMLNLNSINDVVQDL